MAKLLIELSKTEHDRLVANAQANRRTPNQQAAHIIGETLVALEKFGDAMANGVRFADTAAADQEAAGAGPSESYPANVA